MGRTHYYFIRLKLAFLAFLFSTAALSVYFSTSHSFDRPLEVHFLDIGQGDAVYIRSPSGNDMLIDGGPSISVLRRLSEVMPWSDRQIDVVLITHPDADHIGGLPSVFGRYKVNLFIETGIESKNAIDDEIRRLTKDKGIKQVIARRGMRIDLGGGAMFDILFPFEDISGIADTNSASIIGILRYGKTAFLLTGDAGKAEENKIAALDKEGLRSQVLKAGHHGSKTSSGESFVRLVSPVYVVLSAGKNNRYKHPSKEVLEMFNELGVNVLGTYDLGTVTFLSDGQNVYLKEK